MLPTAFEVFKIISNFSLNVNLAFEIIIYNGVCTTTLH